MTPSRCRRVVGLSHTIGLFFYSHCIPAVQSSSYQSHCSCWAPLTSFTVLSHYGCFSPCSTGRRMWKVNNWNNGRLHRKGDTHRVGHLKVQLTECNQCCSSCQRDALNSCDQSEDVFQEYLWVTSYIGHVHTTPLSFYNVAFCYFYTEKKQLRFETLGLCPCVDKIKWKSLEMFASSLAIATRLEFSSRDGSLPDLSHARSHDLFLKETKQPVCLINFNMDDKFEPLLTVCI